MRAATPTAAGDAIEVPSITTYPPGTVEMIPTPGAVRFTSGPTLEKAPMKLSASVP